MAIDNDLSTVLPDPPPPRPARREAAIGEALRRFDGAGGGPPAPPVRERAAPTRGGWGRPQVAALASVALVVLVSVPIWWAERDRIVPQVQQAPSPRAGEAPVSVDLSSADAPQEAATEPTEPEQAPPAATAAHSSSPDASAATLDAPPAPATLGDARARAEVAEPAPQRMTAAPRPMAAAPPPAAARAGSAREEAGERIVVTGSRIQRQDYESAMPITAVNEAALDESDRNACTLLDPRRDVDACRSFADPARRGATGRAAAQLADGLTLAWEGELDPAIDAFDRAIRSAPELSIAYLNRGLAYRAKGDFRRALADLDRAIATDRGSARGYYHRSLIHRARGDTARADADARRAIERDPAYEAVLP